MYKYILLSLLALSPMPTFSKPQQIIPPISAQAHQHFTLQTHDMSVDAEHLYRIFIAVPKTPVPESGYPILYMLDGNAQFPLAVNSYTPKNGNAPLIIAIGYQTDLAYITEYRTRDYTPYSDDPEFAQGGKSEAFYQFIQQQLKPWVEQHYSVNKAKQTLSGHSFGGLFTLYTLFNHPEAFQHYVANSPSIWWGNGIVLPQRDPLLIVNPDSITISVGEYEEKPKSKKPLTPEREKQLAKRSQVTKARAIAEQLKQQGANTTFTLFPKKDHGSAVPDAVALAVEVAGR